MTNLGGHSRHQQALTLFEIPPENGSKSVSSADDSLEWHTQEGGNKERVGACELEPWAWPRPRSPPWWMTVPVGAVCSPHSCLCPSLRGQWSWNIWHPPVPPLPPYTPTHSSTHMPKFTPPYTHTHTHTHTHAHAHMHAHLHTHSFFHTHMHNTQNYTHPLQTRTHAHSHTSAHKFTATHPHPHTRKHTHTQTHTRIFTYTLHIPLLPKHTCMHKHSHTNSTTHPLHRGGLTS